MNDPSDQLPIEPLQTEDDLMIWSHRGTSNLLVLCFSGIGLKTAEVPPIEFAKIATGNGKDSALFISDPNRTWLNGPNLIERIVETASAFAADVGAARIVTLGHSMGGYSAIVISRFIDVYAAIAYSPQYSVHPDVAGDDYRWMRHRRKITRHEIESVADFFMPDTRYHLFHGRGWIESTQRNRFPVGENISHWVVTGAGHAVPRFLRKANVLTDVTRLAMYNRFRKLRPAMASVGGHVRTLDKYPALGPSSELTP